jgi:lipoprotein signal peptidase
MAERTYRWVLISVAVIGLSIDQGSKYGVFRWLYNGGEFNDVNGNSFEIVPGWFKFIAQFDADRELCDCGFSALQTVSAPVMPRVNHGALFGMGADKKGTANWFFAGVSLIAAVAILVWGTRSGPSREKWLSIALGLILGGTIGNLYDRVVFGGVRDFMYFYYIEWPVFNFADCCLVVGAGLLLLQALFVAPPSGEPNAKDSEAAVPTS